MADVVLWIVGVILLALLYVVYTFYIQPFREHTHKSYIPTSTSRPARSFIKDTTKFKYGWGQVMGRQPTGPNSFMLLVATGGRLLHFQYDSHEIIPDNIGDSIAGSGVQSYTVQNVESIANKPQIPFVSVQRMQDELNHVKGRLKHTEHTVERAVDEKVNNLLDIKRQDARKQNITVQPQRSYT